MGNPNIKPKSQLPSQANGLPPPPFWSRPMRHCGRPINQWNNVWRQPVSHRRAAAEEKKLPIVYLRNDIEWGRRHYRKCRDTLIVYGIHLGAWKLSTLGPVNARNNSQAGAVLERWLMVLLSLFVMLIHLFYTLNSWRLIHFGGHHKKHLWRDFTFMVIQPFCTVCSVAHKKSGDEIQLGGENL